VQFEHHLERHEARSRIISIHRVHKASVCSKKPPTSKRNPASSVKVSEWMSERLLKLGDVFITAISFSFVKMPPFQLPPPLFVVVSPRMTSEEGKLFYDFVSRHNGNALTQPHTRTLCRYGKRKTERKKIYTTELCLYLKNVVVRWHEIEQEAAARSTL
jgi:hypothetical protein